MQYVKCGKHTCENSVDFLDLIVCHFYCASNSISLSLYLSFSRCRTFRLGICSWNDCALGVLENEQFSLRQSSILTLGMSNTGDPLENQWHPWEGLLMAYDFGLIIFEPPYLLNPTTLPVVPPCWADAPVVHLGDGAIGRSRMPEMEMLFWAFINWRFPVFGDELYPRICRIHSVCIDYWWAILISRT